jgi:branched-subunit amino acid ABC-type transport system permease component
VAEPAQKSRAQKLALGAFGLVVTLFAMMPVAANASTPTDIIPPEEAEQTIQVWIRLDDATKTPVANVGVNVEGEDFDEDFLTDAEGRVLIGVPDSGEYTVTIDEATLAPEAGFPNKNPRDVAVSSEQKGAPAIFLVSPSNPAMGAEPTSEANGGSQSSGPSVWALFWPKVVTGLIFGLLLALAAIGLSLIYGTTGLNNFAHGELVTFGALMAYTFSGILGWPAPIAIVAAVILGGAFGYVQNKGLWKPLRKRGLGLIPLMIVTIGLSLVLRYTFAFIWGPDRLSLPSDPKPFLVIGSVSLRFTDVAGAVVAIVLLLVVAFILLRTKIGKATRAVADNRSLAAASGIDVEGVIRTVWIGGAALAALSGVFIGYYQSLRWDTGASILLLVFAAVTLGGLGTAFGALVGSLVIGVFINVSTLWLPENLKYVAALVVMIIILLFRPQGILGRRERIG